MQIVPARLIDAEYVGRNLREADIVEVEGLGGNAYDKTIEGYHRSMKRWAAILDGEPIAVFGVAGYNVLSSMGSPWLLGTDLTATVKRSFLVESKPYVAEMLKGYRRLENYVDARNVQSIKWLKWIGFEFEEAKPIGIHGELYHKFKMSK